MLISHERGNMITCKICGNRYEGKICKKCGMRNDIVVPLFKKSLNREQVPSSSQLLVSSEPQLDNQNEFLTNDFRINGQKVEPTKKISLLGSLIKSVIIISGFMLLFILLTQILSFSNKSSDSDSNLKEERMPDNGQIFFSSFPNYDALSTLEVKTTGEYAHVIKVYDELSNQVIIEFFVRPGATHEVRLPIGNFRIKYASGTKWFGHSNLFGSKTQAAITDKTFSFTENGGYTIELFKQSNGNLGETSINADDF